MSAHSKFDDSRISGRPAPKDLRLELARESPDLVEIDAMVVLGDAVAVAVEVLAGDADLPAVREMPTCRQAHAQHRIAGFAEREVHGQVGRTATVGLHVDMLGAEQSLQPTDGQVLDLVDDLLPLVVALEGVTFRVLVGEYRTAGLQDGA